MVTHEDSGTKIQPDTATARIAFVHAPQPRATPSTGPSVKLTVLLALSTSVMLWMSYFPLALSWMSWVALVPFLCLLRMDLSKKRLFWCAYLSGSAFFWSVIQWMRVADFRMYGCWAMLSVYCAFYFPIALGLMRRLDRTPLPFCLNVALVWVGLEYVRSFALTGFAWYYLGHAQHDFLALIQVADLGGAYAVSFVVALVNAAIFLTLYHTPAVRRALCMREPAATSGGVPWNAIAQGTFAFFVVLGALLYGTWRLEQENFKTGPRVALLQMNLDQRLRNQVDANADAKEQIKAIKRVNDHMMALCVRANQQRPDLVIWPETSYIYNWSDHSPEIPLQDIPASWKENEAFKEEYFGQDVAHVCPTHHLIGTSVGYLDANKKVHRFNSALLMNKHRHVVGRYDKMHRVPFGEYVPFKDWFPFMNALAPYDFDYSIRPGDKFSRFQLGEWSFGSIICYEDTDPFLARRYARDEADGKPVDFLVNISNDGWFDGTSEHDEHLAISRFRAVECRRSLVRAVNMGISAVIDGSGRVLKPIDANEFLPAQVGKLPPGIEVPTTWQVFSENGKSQALPVADWDKFKKTYGFLVANVPIDHRESFYAAHGDLLPLGGWIVIGALWLATFFLWRPKPRPVAS